ncbi:hypothetical protein [Sanguibacter sp. 25GB23B1]|uniref:hypothetical protein n=1 Tax=unclassified Sanguibacter TaxID=2645534 RepID=UPI0032AF13C4
MTRRARTILLLAAGLVAVGVLVLVLQYRAAVAGGFFEARFPIDHTFDAAVQSALDADAPTALSDLTEFPWETVTVFSVRVTPEQAEAATGVDLLDRDYSTTEMLLVFCGDASVVRVLPYTRDNLGYGPRSTFSAQVQVLDRRLNDGAAVDPLPRCS